MEAVMEKADVLPKGWKTVQLGDVLEEVIGGGTPSRDNPRYWNGTIPWITVKDMRTRRPESIQEHITQAGVDECATNVIPADTVITATRVGLGKVVRVPYPAAINQDLKALIVGPKLDKSYLEWWILASANHIESIGSGTTVKGIRLNQLKELEIPLAPLPEQRRIVAAIETQLGRLDAALARLHAAKAKLKRYKQAVLKAAVDEASANPKAESVVLADVADLCLGKMLDRQKNVGTPHPYLRNINVRWGTFDTEDLHQMPFGDHEHDRYGLVEGDLVMCEGGEPGRCAVWDGSIPDMKIQKALHRIRCSGQVDPHFVMYNFLSASWQGSIDKYYTGTTIKHLTGKMLARFELVLPPIKEQRRLVARIQEAFDRTEAMEATLDAQLVQAGRLRQAVLKRAFEGRLT